MAVQSSSPVHYSRLSDITLSADQLSSLYTWLDKIPLSKSKRNISRDFSDGCCVAELIQYIYPKMIDLHNYTSTNSINTKLLNWSILYKKCLIPRLQWNIPYNDHDVNMIVTAQKGMIEKFLYVLHYKLTEYKLNSMPSNQRISRRHSSTSNISDDNTITIDMDQPIVHMDNQHKPAKSYINLSNRTNNSNNNIIQPDLTVQHHGKQAIITNVPSTIQSYRSKLTINNNIENKQILIDELRQMNDVLQLKVDKLEQLLQLKNNKIESLTHQLNTVQQNTITANNKPLPQQQKKKSVCKAVAG